MLDPGGIANWTLTYVDWSEGKWHPRTFMPEDVSHELLKNLTVLVSSLTIPFDLLILRLCKLV